LQHTCIQCLQQGLKSFPGSADSSTVETGEGAMKIETNSPAAIQLPADRSAKQVSNNGLAGTQGATEDRTTFHTESTSIQALTSQAMNSPEVRQGKVDALRQSVSSGAYQVDATKTAGAMIENNGE
jgi:flagellar biosynthesis anti-sigma factor FlgM